MGVNSSHNQGEGNSSHNEVLPELNSPNGSGPSSVLSVTSPVPSLLGLRLRLISTLSLSFRLRKFTASTPLPGVGIIGGRMCRSNAHCVVRKNGCDFTSLAPAREPNRRCSSLHNNFRISDLHNVDI
jgi:hypothetical protein